VSDGDRQVHDIGAGRAGRHQRPAPFQPDAGVRGRERGCSVQSEQFTAADRGAVHPAAGVRGRSVAAVGRGDEDGEIVATGDAHGQRQGEMLVASAASGAAGQHDGRLAPPDMHARRCTGCEQVVRDAVAGGVHVAVQAARSLRHREAATLGLGHDGCLRDGRGGDDSGVDTSLIGSGSFSFSRAAAVGRIGHERPRSDVPGTVSGHVADQELRHPAFAEVREHAAALDRRHGATHPVDFPDGGAVRQQGVGSLPKILECHAVDQLLDERRRPARDQHQQVLVIGDGAHEVDQRLTRLERRLVRDRVRRLAADETRVRDEVRLEVRVLGQHQSRAQRVAERLPRAKCHCRCRLAERRDAHGRPTVDVRQRAAHGLPSADGLDTGGMQREQSVGPGV